jgi:hypothetical protein
MDVKADVIDSLNGSNNLGKNESFADGEMLF